MKVRLWANCETNKRRKAGIHFKVLHGQNGFFCLRITVYIALAPGFDFHFHLLLLHFRLAFPKSKLSLQSKWQCESQSCQSSNYLGFHFWKLLVCLPCLDLLWTFGLEIQLLTCNSLVSSGILPPTYYRTPTLWAGSPCYAWHGPGMLAFSLAYPHCALLNSAWLGDWPDLFWEGMKEYDIHKEVSDPVTGWTGAIFWTIMHYYAGIAQIF